MRFKYILKELREEKGLSQMQLSKALEMSQSAIAQWETGRHQPNAEVLIILAEFFNVTIGQLLGVEELR